MIITRPNISDPDAFYEALADAHRGLDAAQSAALNARLVFVLANQVGDTAALLECIAAARRALDRADRGTGGTGAAT